MSIKKYTNGSWTPTSYRKYGTETDTITALPATIIGDGTPITSYTVKGNMEQNGTPTPSSPIYPSECGERTENLFDVNTKNPDNGYVYGKQLTSDGSVDTFPQANISEYIIITPFSSYTFTYGSQYNDVYAALYNAKREFVRSIRYNGKKEITFYSQEDENYLRFTYLRLKENTVMLNSGSTALPYEPYGYKLPITLGSTTTDIYLGEVQSERRVKKLVLTGEESWKVYQTSYYTTVNNYYRAYDVGSHLSACSHYPNAQTNNLPEKHYGLGELIDGQTDTRWNGNIVFNPSPMISSRTDWISYLAAQYAAGTPVTVWYVLEEPETAVVNEPLRKISDYVDSVSGTGLATSGTAQEFDVGTTLKPSEVDMMYHGWHEHDDTKYST